MYVDSRFPSPRGLVATRIAWEKGYDEIRVLRISDSELSPSITHDSLDACLLACHLRTLVSIIIGSRAKTSVGHGDNGIVHTSAEPIRHRGQRVG